MASKALLQKKANMNIISQSDSDITAVQIRFRDMEVVLNNETSNGVYRLFIYFGLHMIFVFIAALQGL